MIYLASFLQKLGVKIESTIHNFCIMVQLVQIFHFCKMKNRKKARLFLLFHFNLHTLKMPVMIIIR